MATPMKEGGRTARNYVSLAGDDIAQLKKVLRAALTSGSPDPLHYVQAIGRALDLADRAALSLTEIDLIYRLSAKHKGRAKDGDSGEERNAP